jgi:transcription elongation factor Elf1
MEEFADIQCPFCGQTFGVAVDTNIANQRFTSDCEVCCRPFEVSVECDDGEIVSLDVSSG